MLFLINFHLFLFHNRARGVGGAKVPVGGSCVILVGTHVDEMEEEEIDSGKIQSCFGYCLKCLFENVS